MGGCQNYDPFSDPYYDTAPNIQGTEKGTIILTTTHTEYTQCPRGVSYNYFRAQVYTIYSHISLWVRYSVDVPELEECFGSGV